MTDEEDKKYTKIVIISILMGILLTSLLSIFFFNWSLVIVSILASHGFAFISSNRFERHIWAILTWGVILLLVLFNKEPNIIFKVLVIVGVGIQVGIVTLFGWSEFNHQKNIKMITEQDDRE